MNTFDLNEALKTTPQYRTAYEQAMNGNDHRGKTESETRLAPQKDTVEQFPLEILPECIQKFIEHAAAALGCPVDLLAIPVLSLAGAAIGASCEIEVKRGWRERANLFSAIVQRPGSKKSPALKLVATPFFQRQRRLYAEYLQEKATYDEKMLQYEIDFSRWKKEAEKGKRTLEEKPKEPKEPVFPQLFTTDATLEALAVLLEQNSHGVGYLSDEISAWVRSFNQYKSGKGTDRQAWLSFWNGAQVVVNRKSRKGPIVLENPFVWVTGCLPPDVLQELSDERGREDGFLHRVLFSFPDPMPLRWTEEEQDQAVLDAYCAVFEELWKLKPVAAADGTATARVLPLSSAAKQEWREWITRHYEEQKAEDFSEQLCGPWSKLEGYAARFALIVHCLRHAAGEIIEFDTVMEDSVASAWSLAHYFKSHARRVYARLLTSAADKRAAAIAEWIKKHNGRASARDLLRANVAGIKKASEANTLLTDLVDRRWGNIEKKGRQRIFVLHLPDTRQLNENADGIKA